MTDNLRSAKTGTDSCPAEWAILQRRVIQRTLREVRFHLTNVVVQTAKMMIPFTVMTIISEQSKKWIVNAP